MDNNGQKKYNVTMNDHLAVLEQKIAPYFIQDDTGETIKTVASVAFNIYAGLASKYQSDMRVAHDETLSDEAVKHTLGIHKNENPELNGIPIVPFEPGMRAAAMKDMWATLTTDDFKEMNSGGDPVTFSGQKLTLDEVKNALPLFSQQGVYNLGHVNKSTGETSLVYDDRTRLPYEFDYQGFSHQLKERIKYVA